MTITMYNYSGENNVVSKDLGTGVPISATFRGDTDVLNPEFLIESGTPVSYNYCYIPEFNRYYFITGVTAVRVGVYRVSCHVDVLKTYDADIRNLPAISARSAKPECQNAYLIDDMVKPYAPQTICTRLLDSNPFTYGAEPRYILITAG